MSHKATIPERSGSATMGDTMRERFEAAAYKLVDDWQGDQHADGTYFFPREQEHWEMWQAAHEAGRQLGVGQARVSCAQYQSLVDAAAAVTQVAVKRADRAEAALRDREKREPLALALDRNQLHEAIRALGYTTHGQTAEIVDMVRTVYITTQQAGDSDTKEN